MRSFGRNLRFALAVWMLAGVATSPDVVLHAEEPAPAAKATPAPQPTPAAQKPESAPQASQEVTPEQMKGVSLEGLTEAQKKLAFSLLTDNRCDCGCGMTLATCRARDSSCSRSLGLATQVVDLVKQGKGRDEIVKTVLTPPSKYVQFDLPVGESPTVGPKNAKVTILYYLDHQ